ncbi:MAG: DMSO reductase [Sulfobacillus thermosulfidooxidans]|nr:MAG: DMSO reductase [Sulfobacillus thermosulfidooxidans]
MRPTWPLLALTLLQGVSWGVMAVVAAALVGGWPVSTGTVQAWEWLAWGTGALGGSASVFHMHRLAAARYVLRRLRSSWLSREALSTGGYMAVLSVAVALRVLWPQARGLWEAATLLAAGLGAVAVYITAMLYATIPAMRSWHSPLTVVVFFAAALLSGGAGAGAVAVIIGGPGWGGWPGLDAAFALGFGALVSLQIRAFRVAAAGVLAATGTGLAGRPYRLQDAGGSRPPYRTQTQIWPVLPAAVRTSGYAAVLVLAVVGPCLAAAQGTTGLVWGAGSAWLGVALSRWMFFADATHSSRVWFADQPKTPSPVRREPGRPYRRGSSIKL